MIEDWIYILQNWEFKKASSISECIYSEVYSINNWNFWKVKSLNELF